MGWVKACGGLACVGLGMGEVGLDPGGRCAMAGLDRVARAAVPCLHGH